MGRKICSKTHGTAHRLPKNKEEKNLLGGHEAHRHTRKQRDANIHRLPSSHTSETHQDACEPMLRYAPTEITDTQDSKRDRGRRCDVVTPKSIPWCISARCNRRLIDSTSQRLKPGSSHQHMHTDISFLCSWQRWHVGSFFYKATTARLALFKSKFVFQSHTLWFQSHPNKMRLSFSDTSLRSKLQITRRSSEKSAR